MKELPIASYPLPSSRNAFTLIELAIVLGVSVIIAVVSIRSFSGYRTGQNLRLVVGEVQAIVQDTQHRSITQEQNSVWGIRFANNTTSTDTVSVFRGTSFSTATTDRVYVVGRGVQFLDPASGTVRDVVFQAISGAPGSYFSVTLGGAGTLQKILSVSVAGTLKVVDAGALTIASITPSSGNNNGARSITTIRGTSFSATSTFALSRSGQTNIPLTGFTLVDSTTVTGGSFALSGAVVGQWSVVVTNGTASATLANGFVVTLPPPSVSSIVPATGTSGGAVSGVTVGGTGFQSGSFSVRLSRAGQSDIPGSGFVFVNSTTVNGGSFNLAGAAVGAWDIVFVNPDGQTGVRTGGFTVQ
jgi:type II secretory pathway pseudopilin PulG